MCVEYRKSYEICFMILKKENTCSFPSHTMMEAYFRIQPAVLCGSVLDCRVAVHFPVGEWTSPNVSSTNTDKLSLVSFVIDPSRLWMEPSPLQTYVEPPPLPGTPEATLKLTGWELPVQRRPGHPGMPTSEPEGNLKSVWDPRGSRRAQQLPHDTRLALSSASPTQPSPCSLPCPGPSSVFSGAAS